MTSSSSERSPEGSSGERALRDRHPDPPGGGLQPALGWRPERERAADAPSVGGQLRVRDPAGPSDRCHRRAHVPALRRLRVGARGALPELRRGTLVIPPPPGGDREEEQRMAATAERTYSVPAIHCE